MSVLPEHEIAAMHSAPGGRLAEAAKDYRSGYGWAVKIVGDAVVLPMTGGLGGVAVPAALGPALVRVLGSSGGAGPAIALVGRPHWVFLADPNGSVVARDPLPPGSRILTAQDCVPLPAPGSRIPACWAVRPVVGSWLPLLDSVLAALAGSPVS